ncbi:hypothetical protein O6H91_03G019600 [Diphasiastrum complanatum]|uniref:Uncharacterized protein n=4 Tax=Diphasiastrum complanatum TaxID=34168 RepID=A0ACC2E3X1_DIPCM|nr:hypothetical protein O6H91_Y002000 [Diphasiastrum complanatum]KAJ7298359.1 hypothetical protein O6H91_Y002000 [Diphasiastrum complanatum]KAJ7298360.1 hypothetical protein O6H91_Y002000 [Diphasiastrum complanatum]KAJ7561223.1 hypothetical protein O6H91_03G019600 [Diphasiastrum complanatum]KAJ7561224.1 hypothetical protein O6H91_03G019600 [Diphasiastrum complanatum]
MWPSRSPERVVISRDGSVLGKKTILKSDHFPGCQNKRLQPTIEGAPNYRKFESLDIYGVAIPTIDGIRRVLNLIGANRPSLPKKVLWHNLREEPVVYVNGRPFVLREVQRPFTNLEYTGINRARVEQMEARLKEDVLQEASRYGNKIMVSDETPDGQMIDQWEPISKDSIKTPLEVYENLRGEGYALDYERVPITDEKSPKERDFDLLVQRISRADAGTAFVFNCQMGRGRTTTGMVIATLIHQRRMGNGLRRISSRGQVLEAEDEYYEVPDNEESFRRGEYTVIRSLIRVLEGGIEGKKQVDNVIDRCSEMQNLREAIAVYRNSIKRQTDERKREAALSLFVEYLERYYFLICFAVYIHTDQSALAGRTPGLSDFQQWMSARPELYSILRRLLRRDPMRALGYGKPPPGFIKQTAPRGHGCPTKIETIVASRTGKVLGRQTVLKSDHYPGCQNLNLPERVEGAPNFRKVQGFPVYGVANPTVDGMRAVLTKIGGDQGGVPVLWHNMREEPVIYINGKPFVLREVERPFKNMLEYTGIDRERVEQMEARLKEDVLREADRSNGAIMVNHETEDGQIFGAWEPVSPKVVKTPLEVFKGLESEGFSVQYRRVPITDGKAPKSSDFEIIASNIASAPINTLLVFNCQMGRGRTTTGTVIACLVKLRCEYGRPIRMPLSVAENSEPDSGCSSGEEGNGETNIYSREDESPKIERQRSASGFVMDDIPIVRKVTRLLENAAEARGALDAVIDHCAAMQNLRQAVLQYRKVFNQQNLEGHVRRAALNRGVEYLERYFMLIAFSSYLASEAFDGYCHSGYSGMPFKVWLHQRPEVRQMRRSMRLRPAQVFALPEIEIRNFTDSNKGDAEIEATINARNGSVLGKGSILKVYFFPGQKKTVSIDGIPGIPGAPNICKVQGLPIHSMATPTVEGAKLVLSQLQTGPTSGPGEGYKAIVTDLREEAVVYIHGNPFVLRELDQPVSTLKYTGIKGPVVEKMESRLKEDILAEAYKSGGRILLHREEYSSVTNQSDVTGYWETITADAVKTPAEVYASLKAEGYRVDYKRIPLSRERAALPTDVDAIQHRLDRAGEKVEYVFISHTGFGGVTYAMAITCLRLKAEKKLATLSAAPLSAPDALSLTCLPMDESTLKSLDDSDLYKGGEYRDILSMTRVIPNGPAIKAEVDDVIDRCGEAGNLRDDILIYKQQLESGCCNDGAQMSYLLNMGVKALRRYFYLIAYASYLCSNTSLKQGTPSGETSFASWMLARPELGHLCGNLKLD